MHTEILPSEERQAKDRAVLVNLVACLVLVAAKTLVGVSSNSLGVLSGAASSGLGLVAAILTYVSVRSDRPAGDHARIEQIAVLLKTAVLLFACVWIVRESVARLGGKLVHVDISSAVFAVLLLGMIVDYFRARTVARGMHGDASEAAAWRVSRLPVDSSISAMILLGVAATWADDRLGIPWLGHGDSLAALVAGSAVLVLLLRVGAQRGDAGLRNST